MPEDDPEIFATYLHFICTNEFCVLPNTNGETQKEVKDSHLMTQMSLVRLYVLAEKLQDVKSKDGILRGIIKNCHIVHPPDDMRYLLGADPIAVLYKGTPKGSMARRIAVEYKAWEGNAANITSVEWPKEFLAELAFELMTFGQCEHDKKAPYWRRDHPEKYMEEESEE
ncbi:hypothetical protein E8E13_001582 [Curvularia kusanoi]|uniref:Uncharacterized protein n=1 Tax=Curvularia kusanoi TaxID=90978 RepID=A0A9P4WD39_CURKU|nr:hypothetical protein E8E13_001582 [Curvularia kusanoi]